MTALQWTPDLVKDFWDHWSSVPRLQELYFTRQVGEQLADFISYVRPLRGAKVLDYGCGAGDLMAEMLAHGASVYGVDPSGASRDAAIIKNGGALGFMGVESSIRWMLTRGIDLITCIETIEHMDDAALDQMFEEFRRILRPRGHVVITTPNSEDLAANQVYCPQCRHEFHRVQHVRSWTSSTLSEFLFKRQFGVEFCAATDLTLFNKPPKKKLSNYTLGELKAAVTAPLWRALEAVPKDFPGNVIAAHKFNSWGPHLIAVAHA